MTEASVQETKRTVIPVDVDVMLADMALRNDYIAGVLFCDRKGCQITCNFM
jgi:hypothetical protein